MFYINKRILKKIISLTLVLLFLFLNCFPILVTAETSSRSKSYNKFEIDENIYNVITNKVKNMQRGEHNLNIERIAYINDFSGETYILVECNPAGYAIYHPNSGTFVEYSSTSLSPYANYISDNLYYFGPTEYYVKIDGIYYHTVINETINSQSDIENMKIHSENIKLNLENNKNIAVLDYVINNNKTAYSTITSHSTYAIKSGLSQSEIDWFKNLNECSYYSTGDGCCGYVGLAILYGFFDKFKDDKYMDDSYWTDSSKTSLKSSENSFTKYLYDLDPKDSTTCIHIHSVSKQYLSKKGISDISHTSRVWGFFTKSTIKNLIDDGYPVELFGNLEDPPNYNGSGKKGGHAVIAYQYSGNDFICHYGWENYTEVTIVGTLGSIYAMEVE